MCERFAIKQLEIILPASLLRGLANEGRQLKVQIVLELSSDLVCVKLSCD